MINFNGSLSFLLWKLVLYKDGGCCNTILLPTQHSVFPTERSVCTQKRTGVYRRGFQQAAAISVTMPLSARILKQALFSSRLVKQLLCIWINDSTAKSHCDWIFGGQTQMFILIALEMMFLLTLWSIFFWKAQGDT